MTRCDSCGKLYGVGEWPFCPHGIPHGMQTFTPYFDEHISEKGEYITSLAQKWRLQKLNRVIEKDPMSKGEFSARLNKNHERRKEKEYRARYR